jgi:hypothetical protein
MEHNYDIIKEIAEDFVFQTYGNENPGGMCFSLCFPLSVLYTLMGFDHKITFGKSPINHTEVSHFWITLDKNGTILDPTIRQFNSNDENVYLGNRIDNETTKRYQIYECNLDDEFSQNYHSWAELLFQHEHRMPRTQDFEKRLITFNVATAQVLFKYLLKYGLLEKLKTSYYGLSYFRPISFILKENYPIDSVLFGVKSNLDNCKDEIIELGLIQANI